MARIENYVLLDEIAAGGMGQVHIGCKLGSGDFARVVALKRVREEHTKDPEVAAMLIDEARIASRLHHPNIVPVLDVVRTEGEILVVSEWVDGLPLSELSKKVRVPPAIASAIIGGLLRGLESAHNAKDRKGAPLELIHRDVSPQNVLVDRDGNVRLIDFGIAKARGRLVDTRTGVLKGKILYMPPEQLRGQPIDTRVDIWAASLMLYELLTGKHPFLARDANEVMERVLIGQVDPPSKHVPELDPAIDDLVLRGLEERPQKRHRSAAEMAEALEKAIPPAYPSEIAAWVEERGGARLAERAAQLEAAERSARALAKESAPAVAEKAPPVLRSHERKKLGPLIGILTVSFVLALLIIVFGTKQKHAPTPGPPTSPTTSLDDAPAETAIVTLADPLPVPCVTPSGRPPRLPPRKVAADRDRCAIPFVLDDQGRRVYKRECL